MEPASWTRPGQLSRHCRNVFRPPVERYQCSWTVASGAAPTYLRRLRLGATAVGVGRPYLWGLTAFGQRGVVQVMNILQSELATDMGMAGTGKISEIDRSYVRAPQ